MPARTPADVAADVAGGDVTYTDTANRMTTRAAHEANLRDHAVRLMKWRDRHGLRGCCYGQGKGKSDQPDHCFPPM
jgi:hypothetical protein